MKKIIIDEKLYGHDFVTKWSHGFDQLKKRAQKYPVDKIEKAARLYATTKPVDLYRRVAVEPNTNSTHSIRAIASLIALTYRAMLIYLSCWA
jgi:anaerobic selenocysteine-containing dehydrogenase